MGSVIEQLQICTLLIADLGIEPVRWPNGDLLMSTRVYPNTRSRELIPSPIDAGLLKAKNDPGFILCELVDAAPQRRGRNRT